VDAYSAHPWLYQVLHPWHWLTYGQNATGIGVLLATFVNWVTIFVLVRTLSTVNRQAQAADRQAEAAEAQADAARKQTEVSEQQRIAAERAANAAEQQVAAAKSAMAVSEAQRIATEQGALAEREHSELIRQQLLAALRPILVIVGARHSGGIKTYSIENHGEGVALAMKASYRNGGLEEIAVSPDILGPNHSAPIQLHWHIFRQSGMQVRYESADGRFFVTVALPNANKNDLNQTAFEVDAHGGHLLQPRIEPERTNQPHPSDKL
jgi:multidrug efflux pump subunit AcrA (membrane-fusion protein)